MVFRGYPWLYALGLSLELLREARDGTRASTVYKASVLHLVLIRLRLS